MYETIEDKSISYQESLSNDGHQRNSSMDWLNGEKFSEGTENK
jgi:hypothetical protein